MNSRLKAAMMALAGLALGAGLWLTSSHDEGARQAARRAEPRTAMAPSAARRSSPPPAPEVTPCDLECVARVRKAAREARVVEALARVERRTGHITRETIEREQEHLAATAQALHARETEMPIIEEEVDESGARWRKLAYADGAVRYALPEEP
jgi:hypothetical protein